MKIPRITDALNHISDDKITQADQPRKKRSALPLVCSLGGTCVAAAVLGVVLLNGKPVSKPPVMTSSDIPSPVSSGITSEPTSAPVSQTASSGEVSEPTSEPTPGALPNYFTPYEGSGFSIDRDDLPFKYNGGEPTKISAEPFNGGMGFLGYYAYDVSELKYNNPWNKDLEITELPIFKGGRPTWTDIELSPDLPDGYSLDEGVDIETEIKTVRYLAEKYSDLLGYTDYELDVSHDYNYRKEPSYWIQIYESSDNAFDAIMNYNFASSSFYYDSFSNKLFLRKGDGMDKYTCTGFYPTITADTAREMLLAGKYSTTVPEMEYLKDGLTEDIVKHVELMYLPTNGGMVIPYYRFLVEIDSVIEGINHYGAFDVPAISPEYLEGMDTTARFN